jgi:hydroxyacyl-ACP dehydratase HTD2-like protein with hotdog domain
VSTLPKARTLVEQEWRPDELELFLFSAALWLPHRIHYDREFALSDGHRGLVVHGPLQIARLLEAAGAWSREASGRIASAEFRHVSPAVAGDSMRLSLELVDEAAVTDPALVRIGASAAVVGPSGECTPTTTGTVNIEREG